MCARVQVCAVGGDYAFPPPDACAGLDSPPVVPAPLPPAPPGAPAAFIGEPAASCPGAPPPPPCAAACCRCGGSSLLLIAGRIASSETHDRKTRSVE